jgi:N-acetyltransferase
MMGTVPWSRSLLPSGMSLLGPVLLANAVVTLEPLSREHAEPLWCAASLGRESYRLTSVPASRDAVSAYIELALSDQARGASIPFVSRDSRTGDVVGSTRLLNLERWTRCQ